MLRGGECPGVRPAAQRIGALPAHAYHEAGVTNRFGVGERLDEAVQQLGRPAVGALP